MVLCNFRDCMRHSATRATRIADHIRSYYTDSVVASAENAEKSVIILSRSPTSQCSDRERELKLMSESHSCPPLELARALFDVIIMPKPAQKSSNNSSVYSEYDVSFYSAILHFFFVCRGWNGERINVCARAVCVAWVCMAKKQESLFSSLLPSFPGEMFTLPPPRPPLDSTSFFFLLSFSFASYTRYTHFQAPIQVSFWISIFFCNLRWKNVYVKRALESHHHRLLYGAGYLGYLGV